METVTISKAALEFLTRRTLEWYDYDFDMGYEPDREAAISLDAAIKALDLQSTLDAERAAAMEERNRQYREQKAAEKAEAEEAAE